MRRWLLCGAAAGAALFLALVAVVGFSGVGAGAQTCAAARVQVGASKNLTETQAGNAAVIIGVGQDRRVPTAGQVIAVATGMVESGLRNLANSAYPESMALPHDGVGHDHDSAGVMQQRPSQGWGSFAEVQNVAYAAGKFYDRLLRLSGWQVMPPGDAAQAVQASAFPGAYAQQIPQATALVGNAVAGAPDCGGAVDTTGGTVTSHDAGGKPVTLTLPSGQAGAAIRAALTQLGKPYNNARGDFDYFTTDDPPYLDCSGLTMWAVWQGSGKTIRIPPTSQTQWAGLPHVTEQTARPGDLILYEGDPPGHVTMYVGKVSGVDWQIAATTFGQPLQLQPTYQPITGWAHPPYKE